jgi:flagellin-like protein
MLQKIAMLPLAAYIAFTGLMRDLRNDERGLSGIVVTVLLILVAVLAVVMVWGFLSGWLTDLWENITNTADTIS